MNLDCVLNLRMLKIEESIAAVFESAHTVVESGSTVWSNK